MKNLLSITFIFSFLIFISCKDSNTPKAGTGDFSQYTMTPIPGSEAQLAIMTDAGGVLLEKGIVVNGMKNGTWTTFHPGDKFMVKTSTSFVNGVKNGPHFEFNDRGQIELQANYLNDQLHGAYGKYKFGRSTVLTEYKNGQFHGVHKEFFNSGKVQKYVEFKDGVQDGLLRYYDEEGNITLEYTYKNGEKVSGGIVEKES